MLWVGFSRRNSDLELAHSKFIKVKVKEEEKLGRGSWVGVPSQQGLFLHCGDPDAGMPFQVALTALLCGLPRGAPDLGPGDPLQLRQFPKSAGSREPSHQLGVVVVGNLSISREDLTMALLSPQLFPCAAWVSLLHMKSGAAPTGFLRTTKEIYRRMMSEIHCCPTAAVSSKATNDTCSLPSLLTIQNSFHPWLGLLVYGSNLVGNPTFSGCGCCIYNG